ncbi:cittilin family RiPP precursor [Lentzea tibetensis]
MRKALLTLAVWSGFARNDRVTAPYMYY